MPVTAGMRLDWLAEIVMSRPTHAATVIAILLQKHSWNGDGSVMKLTRKRMSVTAGISERTVTRSINELSKAGFLLVTGYGMSSGKSSSYLLTVQRGGQTGSIGVFGRGDKNRQRETPVSPEGWQNPSKTRDTSVAPTH